MIETTIYNYLKQNLSVPVYIELPKDITAEKFVVIEKIGLRQTDHVASASIAFQSYSTARMADAAELDETVRYAVEDMISLPEIGGVHLESNYNHTDTSTKWYRYQCIYGITYIERRNNG